MKSSMGTETQREGTLATATVTRAAAVVGGERERRVVVRREEIADQVGRARDRFALARSVSRLRPSFREEYPGEQDADFIFASRQKTVEPYPVDTGRVWLLQDSDTHL
jgi:hypothetical protein